MAFRHRAAFCNQMKMAVPWFRGLSIPFLDGLNITTIDCQVHGASLGDNSRMHVHCLASQVPDPAFTWILPDGISFRAQRGGKKRLNISYKALSMYT